jgi:hypothetical protein
MQSRQKGAECSSDKKVAKFCWLHALSLVRHVWGPQDVRMKLTIEGDGKGPVSRVHFPLVLPVTPPAPLCGTLFGLFYFIFRLPGVCARGSFRISQPSFSSGTTLHTLSESTCRKWGESTKGKAWSGSKLGRAGDGARELLPWTACTGTQKNLDPEHPLARAPGADALRSFYILV